jgi:hypothetical protein
MAASAIIKASIIDSIYTDLEIAGINSP